jgi:ribosome-associated protein
MAVRCAAAKKATDIKVLDLKEVTSFTDYFVLCSVSNPRQGHAVCDEIEKGLREMGERPVSVEGFNPSEWILMDYGDFLVHIFSASARSFYDLERLWRHAKVLEIPES